VRQEGVWLLAGFAREAGHEADEDQATDRRDLDRADVGSSTSDDVFWLLCSCGGLNAQPWL
jgi:hypothetical protein